MRKLVHLSDLHFGRIDERVVGPLAEAVRDARPSLVVVSGDLTQRARARQFREARAFLDRLPKPRVVVPGNHDVPLWDVLARFARPFDKPPGHDEREVVGRAEMAMGALASCGADLLLAGHLHVGHTGHTAERYK